MPALDALVNRFSRQLRSTARVGEQVIRHRNCTTVTPPSGASTTDGATAVYIQVGADQLPAPYIGTAPAVGSTVAVMFVNGSPLILGRPVGFPAL